MTPGELRARLLEVLQEHLGTFQPKGEPAIRVGEPPAKWTFDAAAGKLEVNIELDPVFENTPLQNQEHQLVETYRVRLIGHEGSSLAAPIRAVVRAFSDASVTPIPRNEALGILSQVLIEIPN